MAYLKKGTHWIVAKELAGLPNVSQSQLAEDAF